ncbi:11093_t:CDS:2 [Funneliformis mosseae]|uniref:11093_t:CDS:1 n=1 Tax=Funneliformis mosseae TaxID=27381 RepID=A0A9N9GAU8_FUNMO|nr:11093_t:CDS:2 [Funneliformis mosseae]
MALYLIRNGYPPIVFQQVPREEYGATLFLAQTEKDSTGLKHIQCFNEVPIDFLMINDN